MHHLYLRRRGGQRKGFRNDIDIEGQQFLISLWYIKLFPLVQVWMHSHEEYSLRIKTLGPQQINKQTKILTFLQSYKVCTSGKNKTNKTKGYTSGQGMHLSMFPKKVPTPSHEFVFHLSNKAIIITNIYTPGTLSGISINPHCNLIR